MNSYINAAVLKPDSSPSSNFSHKKEVRVYTCQKRKGKECFRN